MKKNEFVKLIREVVRKEVRYAVRTELREALNPPDNSVQTFNEQINDSVQRYQTAERAPIKQQKYSNNEMLNGILNETANSMNAVPTAGRPLTAADAVGGRGSLAAAMGLPSLNQNAGPTTIQEMVPADRQGAPIPDAVSKALTRDYSGLMKAVNKKRGK